MEKGIVNVFEIMHGIGDWGVCVLVAELFEGCSICFQHLFVGRMDGIVGRIGTI